LRKQKPHLFNGGVFRECFLLRQPGLACATNFVGSNAAGANGYGFMLTIRQNHFAFLQVGVLEETVVLVGKANFVGFVATLVTNFTNAGHGGKSFTIMHRDSSAYYLSINKEGWQHVPASKTRVGEKRPAAGYLRPQESVLSRIDRAFVRDCNIL
jgi:hypothetical protein